MIRKILSQAKAQAKKIPLLGLVYRSLREVRFLWQEPQATSLGFKMTGNNAMSSGTHDSDLAKS
jgi:hypothetical protein